MAKLVAKQKVLAVDFKRPILHGSMATECNVSRSLDWWIGPESNSRNSAVCPTSFEAKNSEILLTWKTRKMYLKNWFRFIQSRDPNFVTLVAFLAALHFFMLGEFISFFFGTKTFIFSLCGSLCLRFCLYSIQISGLSLVQKTRIQNEFETIFMVSFKAREIFYTNWHEDGDEVSFFQRFEHEPALQFVRDSDFVIFMAGGWVTAFSQLFFNISQFAEFYCMHCINSKKIAWMHLTCQLFIYVTSLLIAANSKLCQTWRIHTLALALGISACIFNFCENSKGSWFDLTRRTLEKISHKASDTFSYNILVPFLRLLLRFFSRVRLLPGCRINELPEPALFTWANRESSLRSRDDLRLPLLVELDWLRL